MSLLGNTLRRQMAFRVSTRGLATTPVRVHGAAATGLSARKNDQRQETVVGIKAPGTLSSAALAGSPLFLTDLDKPMYFGEIQFIFSENINFLFERMFETEAGPLFLNSMVFLTLLRLGSYYGFMQPSYLWNFQEKYGQSWTVGHHLYGSNLPNPLKKKA
eukprot:gnl/MRDRNA2_/MRDRNA2_28713_c1_seq1.p1 gnl/MRDRNA2_/MRDRNA2_28713_c1~~gnl/MRDRNA2_/MRDRNA2_28713_c1_seq1.p1  ORF type:complete len:160 (-),score=25.14 gnl/MRDRNA2_/MRDRNA2_28713_c1_seq1:268-747(-)